MKIAYIVWVFPKLSETFITDQIIWLLKKGYDIKIFSDWKSEEKKIHEDVLQFDLINRTTYFFGLRRERPKFLLKFPLAFVRNLFQRPIVIQNFLRKGIKSRHTVFRADAVLNGKWDVIHCHYGPNGEDMVYIKDVMDVNFVTSFYGYDATRYVAQNGPNVYNELFEKGDIFIVPTDFIKKKIIKIGCSAKKIIEIPVGLDIEKFSFKEKQIDQNKIKILTVARLIEVKGLEFGIKAISKIVKKHSNVHYNIVGDGPLRKNLQRLIFNLDVKDKIHLLGWKTRQEIISLLQESHLFLLPSIKTESGAEEAQGLAIQEAQACGLPVVATRVGGIPEGVIDKKSGFLVPEKNVDALVEKIDLLIEHPELWPELGRAGRDFVEKKYDLQKLNKKLISIYRSL